MAKNATSRFIDGFLLMPMMYRHQCPNVEVRIFKPGIRVRDRVMLRIMVKFKIKVSVKVSHQHPHFTCGLDIPT